MWLPPLPALQITCCDGKEVVILEGMKQAVASMQASGGRVRASSKI